MKPFSTFLGGRLRWPIAQFWFTLAAMATHVAGATTNGYITAVLRTERANAPTPPPPVGGTRVSCDLPIVEKSLASPVASVGSDPGYAGLGRHWISQAKGNRNDWWCDSEVIQGVDPVRNYRKPSG